VPALCETQNLKAARNFFNKEKTNELRRILPLGNAAFHAGRTGRECLLCRSNGSRGGPTRATWLFYAIFGLVVFPWILAFATVPNLRVS
jgi:hypothetical protein